MSRQCMGYGGGGRKWSKVIKSVDAGAKVPGFESSSVTSSCMALEKPHALLVLTS